MLFDVLKPSILTSERRGASGSESIKPGSYIPYVGRVRTATAKTQKI